MQTDSICLLHSEFVFNYILLSVTNRIGVNALCIKMGAYHSPIIGDNAPIIIRNAFITTLYDCLIYVCRHRLRDISRIS